jgi:cell division septation protein DedD
VSPAPEGPPERRTGWEALERWVKDDAAEAGAGEPEAPPRPVCSTCAAALEDDQTYCLDCGAPTPLAPRLTRSSRSVAILAVALAALGIGAGALAYAVAEGDGGGSGDGVVTTTTPGAPLPTETGFGTLPADTTGGFPTTSSATTPLVPPSTTGFGTTTSGVPPVTTGTGSTPSTPATPTTPTTGGGADDWPAGETAWTAQVSSVRNLADAQALRTRLRNAGQEAGVLDSDDFTELEPGYYVVFSGTFDSRAEAIAHAASLRSEHPGVFARRLAG